MLALITFELNLLARLLFIDILKINHCSPLINVYKCLVVYLSWGIDFGIIELLDPFPVYKNLHPSPHIHLILPRSKLFEVKANLTGFQYKVNI